MDFQSAMETFAEAWMAANTTKPRPALPASAAVTTTGPEPALGATVVAAVTAAADSQREGSSERTINGRMEDEGRDSNTHLTNGGSPHRHSPISLAREHEGSPKPPPVGKGPGGGGIPIHVVVEGVPLCSVEVGVAADLRGRVEVDTLALIPANTRFTDIMQAVLVKLQLQDDIPNARGLLQLRNWRPMPLEQIPETEDKTVADILQDVVPIATLHIRIYSPWKARCARDIKDRLLRLLLQQSHHLLVSAGCPLDEHLLTTLIRGSGEVSEESARAFEAWWAVHVAHAAARAHHQQQQQQQQQQQHTPTVTPTGPPPHLLAPQQHHLHPQLRPTHPLSLDKVLSDPLHPAMQSMGAGVFGPQKTRMRTSFDPELELPRLHRWFAENQHPTRQQIQHYVGELNALESRRGRKPLDVANVVYWFKNARAAYKRQEFRSINGLKSPPHDETSVSDNEDNHDQYPSMPVNLQHSPPTSIASSEQHSQQLHLEGSNHQRTPSVDSLVKQEQDETHGGCGDNIDSVEGRTLGSIGGGGSEGHARSPCVTPRAIATMGDQHPPPPSSMESDVDMSEDEDDIRSRDSGHNESRVSPPSVISPSGLSLPPYPGIPGLGMQPGMDRLPYPVVPGSLLQHSMMYMAHYMPQVSPFSGGLATSHMPEERRKRNRTFIDPVSEVPRLEQWFAINTHPSHNLILKYTEELNRMPYRQKFPKLEPKNVQFWFKNRRAKCKRLRVQEYPKLEHRVQDYSKLEPRVSVFQDSQGHVQI
ncbi:unnamed protein product [Meganyctiphanes norvegica]|uniref:Uncharacterized protein n=1 Tax=Meganyctiphanes norvegica TaxID=48144 RepID=A0AAV2QWV8_MEGNR